jgi:Domain of unknown function (DUF4394)
VVLARRAAAAVAASICCLFAAAPAQAAQRFYAVTASNQLVSFNSDSPGAVRSSKAITGLEEGERIEALDVRPGDGRLYGVADGSRLVTLDPATARATPVGSEPFSPGLRGQSVGFDFDPATGVPRIVTEDAQNQRIDPVSGQTIDGFPISPATQPDRDLSYAGDPPSQGVEETPRVTALAFARPSRLYGIDTARNLLVVDDSPNAGLLRPVGSLGIDIDETNGFDVAADGHAWAALLRIGRPETGLLKVDLAKGAVSKETSRNAIGTYLRGQPDPVRGLAAAGPVAADRTRPRVRVKVLRRLSRRSLLRRRTVPVAIRCNEACRIAARVTLGRRTVGRASARILGRPGRVVARLGLSTLGRRFAGRRHGARLRYRLSVVDAAGNRVARSGRL